MEPFKFYWSSFNLSAGLKYVLSILILYLLSQWINFPWFIVGVSALLAWLIGLLGKPKPAQRALLVLLYMVIGLGLSYISYHFKDQYWPWVTVLFLVALLGVSLIRYGGAWFMLGWSLAYWFLLLPVMHDASDGSELFQSHLLGSGIVLFLVVLESLWNRVSKKQSSNETPTPESYDPPRLAWLYSLLVALLISGTMILGDHWFTTDPTMMANAAFMVVGFSSGTTWKAALERIIAVVLAIFIGFYVAYSLDNEVLGMIISVVMSFFVLALVEVNNGLVMFCFLLIMGYNWGLQDFEVGNTMANERIFAEISGVVLAGITISFFNSLRDLLITKQSRAH